MDRSSVYPSNVLVWRSDGERVAMKAYRLTKVVAFRHDSRGDYSGFMQPRLPVQSEDVYRTRGNISDQLSSRTYRNPH
jgi:hypothetical protein